MPHIADLGPSVPKILVSTLERDELVLGAFQRSASALHLDALPSGAVVTRRRSGGPAVWASRRTLHLTLVLPAADALTPGDPSRIVNRYVRPLLRALTSLGRPAHYFGRDWISIDKRPAAWVGFAHDHPTRSCLFEAFVPLDSPFVLPPNVDAYPARRADPFLGKSPVALVDLFAQLAQPIDAATLATKIITSYDQAFGEIARGAWTTDLLRPLAHDDQPAFDVLREEVIGFVGASFDRSRNKLTIGGDLFASEGLLDDLAALAVSRDSDDHGALETRWLDHISESSAVLDGVQHLESLVDVALRATSDSSRR